MQSLKATLKFHPENLEFNDYDEVQTIFCADVVTILKDPSCSKYEHMNTLSNALLNVLSKKSCFESLMFCLPKRLQFVSARQ